MPKLDWSTLAEDSGGGLTILEALQEEAGALEELFETGSLTIPIGGKPYVISLQVEPV